MTIKITPAGGVKIHSRLLGLLSDDHTQYALLAGRAGGQVLNGGNAGGNTLTLVGNTVDSGAVIIGNPAPLQIQATVGHLLGGSGLVSAGGNALTFQTVGGYTPTSQYQAINMVPNIVCGAVGASAFGVSGLANIKTNGFAGNSAFGMDFIAVGNGAGGGNLVDLIGLRVRLSNQISALTLTRLAGMVARAPSMTVTPAYTNCFGIQIEDQSNARLITKVISLQIDEHATPANNFLTWVGGATPSLQVIAGGPPNLASTTAADSANRAAFNENGTVTLRKLQWKQQSTLVAGDKILVAV